MPVPVSGIDTLEHFHDKFMFCHWDFHGDNIMFNKQTCEIKLYDFDLSSIDLSLSPKPIDLTYQKQILNSDYIQRVPFFFTLIDICIEKGILRDYHTVKNFLAHYFDIYH